jgi:hypothetical protein
VYETVVPKGGLPVIHQESPGDKKGGHGMLSELARIRMRHKMQEVMTGALPLERAASRAARVWSIR